MREAGITPKQLDDFHKRLSRIDRRARNRTRPSGSFFTTRTVLRLLAVVVGLILVVAVAVAESSHLEGFSAEQAESLLYLSILAPVLSALFATLAIRIAIASDAAWRRVYARQRIDIQKMLEEFDRTTRKRVPGLRKRVANALNILREQQP